MTSFIQGDLVRITKTIFKGKTGIVLAWHHDNVYTVKTFEGTEIVLIGDEMEKI